MNTPHWSFPYTSTRLPVFGDGGVATTQPLAAQAGVSMLVKGGNAVDAALAAAIALTVVEPTSNGIGSDAFAIVWDGERLHGLNASGRSPAGWNPARFAGRTEMPLTGWDTVTIPGAVSAWVELSRRFGRLPFADLFEPAIRYAKDGYLVPVFVARNWAAQVRAFQDQPTFRSAFMPNGQAPQPGERFRFPQAAHTLESIAISKGESFYLGDIARAIVAFAQQEGGTLTLEDLSEHAVEWCTPLSVPFGDVAIHELPPNGQGIAALIALALLNRTDLPGDVDDPLTIHLAVEAMRLGLADLNTFVADPPWMPTTAAELLDGARLDELARRIDPNHTSGHFPAPSRAEGTVFLASGDRDGMMVSFIQSNYRGFGCGLVVPGTGISLQNRGSSFVLTPGHPNEVGSRKRPLSTIIPGFLTRAGAPLAAFGVMGGGMQPQAHTQMVLRMVRYRQNPQAAADAPRWMVLEDGALAIEDRMPADVGATLGAKGHRIAPFAFAGQLGAAQVIQRLPAGGYVAATESRRDGIAAMI